MGMKIRPPSQSTEYPNREEKGVCFFVGKLFTASGAASQALLLARELAGAGFTVFLFTYPPSDPTPPCELFPPRLDQLPPQIEVVVTERTERSFADAVRDLQHRFSTGIFFGVPHAYKVMILKSLGKKIVMRITGYRFDELRNNPVGEDIFPYLSLADRFISISPPLSHSFSKAGLDTSRLVEIPNMVDSELYSPINPGEKKALRLALKLPADAFLIIYVGNFKHEKGIDILLKAWEMIRAENNKAYLLLLGPLCSKCGGVEKPCEEEGAAAARVEQVMNLLTGKLSHLIEQHERIIFAGVRENVRDYLRVSDLFLFPSRREGMPNALMEAMACSLACVTSAIEEITAELIPSSRFGLTVSGENPQDYAQAVSKLIADEDWRKRLGKEARRRVKNKFSPARIGARYCDLVGDISAENRQSLSKN
jgi:glycosyltransferase involved in cell wall biosynthesis